MTSLEISNSHERDKNIEFIEEGHVYNINGNTSFTSTTTFVHRLFPYFNEDKIIDNMMKGSNWESSKYYGKTKKEIKDMWKVNRISSATLGTKMHKYIEDYYNNKEFTQEQITDSQNNIEYSYFENFKKNHADIVPFRTEWLIYDEHYQISGSVDFIVKNDDDTYTILDWKRSKQIEKDNRFNKFAKFPNSDLDDNNYTHYCLQLNIYKYIIEKNYNKKIKDMYLVVLHPENKLQNYEKIKVVDMQSRVKKLLDAHYQYITRKK